MAPRATGSRLERVPPSALGASGCVCPLRGRPEEGGTKPGAGVIRPSARRRLGVWPCYAFLAPMLTLQVMPRGSRIELGQIGSAPPGSTPHAQVGATPQNMAGSRSRKADAQATPAPKPDMFVQPLSRPVIPEVGCHRSKKKQHLSAATVASDIPHGMLGPSKGLRFVRMSNASANTPRRSPFRATSGRCRATPGTPPNNSTFGRPRPKFVRSQVELGRHAARLNCSRSNLACNVPVLAEPKTNSLQSSPSSVACAYAKSDHMWPSSTESGKISTNWARFGPSSACIRND